jgi:hypothetical protein
LPMTRFHCGKAARGSTFSLSGRYRFSNRSRAEALRVSTLSGACVVYALDGVSWVQGGSIQIAVGRWLPFYKIRAVVCSCPRALLLLGAGLGLQSRRLRAYANANSVLSRCIACMMIAGRRARAMRAVPHPRPNPPGQRACPIPTHLGDSRKRYHGRRGRLYRASKLDCDTCKLRAQCCPNALARKIPRDLVGRHPRRGPCARRNSGTRGGLSPSNESRCCSRTSSNPPPQASAFARSNGAKNEFLLAATAQNQRRLARLMPSPGGLDSRLPKSASS